MPDDRYFESSWGPEFEAQYDSTRCASCGEFIVSGSLVRYLEIGAYRELHCQHCQGADLENEES